MCLSLVFLLRDFTKMVLCHRNKLNKAICITGVLSAGRFFGVAFLWLLEALEAYSQFCLSAGTRLGGSGSEGKSTFFAQDMSRTLMLLPEKHYNHFCPR